MAAERCPLSGGAPPLAREKSWRKSAEGPHPLRGGAERRTAVPPTEPAVRAERGPPTNKPPREPLTLCVGVLGGCGWGHTPRGTPQGDAPLSPARRDTWGWPGLPLGGRLGAHRGPQQQALRDEARAKSSHRTSQVATHKPLRQVAVISPLLSCAWGPPHSVARVGDLGGPPVSPPPTDHPAGWCGGGCVWRPLLPQLVGHTERRGASATFDYSEHNTGRCLAESCVKNPTVW